MTALFFDGFATTWHGDSREESEPIGLSTNEIGKIVVDVARQGSGVAEPCRTPLRRRATAGFVNAGF